MCGNGIRVFAKYLVDRGLRRGDAIAVQTLGGIKHVETVRDDDGLFVSARVDMGEPVLAAVEIPTTLPGDPVLDARLTTGLGDVAVTCVSMGNPHAVLWVDDVDEAPVTTLGPAIEELDAFPRATNVEFAQVADPGRIRLRVWERGVGETLACGTGACATLVAGVLTGRCGRSAIVELPGRRAAHRVARGRQRLHDGPGRGRVRGRVAHPGRGLDAPRTGRSRPAARVGGVTMCPTPGRAPGVDTRLRREDPSVVRTANRIANLPPYLFAEIDRKVGAEDGAGHRRHLAGHRRPRPPHARAHRRGDGPRDPRPEEPPVPELLRLAAVPRGVLGVDEAPLRRRRRPEHRDARPDRQQGGHRARSSSPSSTPAT